MSSPKAHAILNGRYVRGEITREQYLDMKKIIGKPRHVSVLSLKFLCGHDWDDVRKVDNFCTEQWCWKCGGTRIHNRLDAQMAGDCV